MNNSSFFKFFFSFFKSFNFLLFVAIVFLLSINLIPSLKFIESTLKSNQLSFTVNDFRVSVYLIIQSFAVLMLFFLFAKKINAFVEIYIRKITNIPFSNKLLIIKFFQIFSYTIIGFLALNILGINLSGLAIFGGAIGIGIGFGLQKITSNFISGLILLFERSIESGDFVELTDGTLGFIVETSARFTLIETFDGKEIMVPNEQFINDRVTNWTFSNTKARIDISIGVAYGTDLEKAKKIILETAKKHVKCLFEPQPSCYLVNFGDNSIDFILYFWIGDVLGGRLGPKSDVMFAIVKKFEDNGIEIPFPQRDVHIKR